MTTEQVDPRVARTHRDVRRAAGELLLGDGWDAVTHASVAKRAGYSRPTIYAHWPTQVDLITEAFAHIGEIPHHEPTGDLRQDLIQELRTFRTVLVDEGLGRALSALAERAFADPAIAALRDHHVEEATRVCRSILETHFDAHDAEFVLNLMGGAVIYWASWDDRSLDDDVIDRIVDTILAGMDGAQGSAD